MSQREKINVKMKNTIGLFLLIALLGTLYGCGGGTEYKLKIGEPGEEEVAKEVEEFNSGDTIGFEMSGKKAVETSSIRILFVKYNGDTETIIDEFDDSIDPSWNWFYNYYEDSNFDTGEYAIKIFKGEGELLAQKRFEIK